MTTSQVVRVSKLGAPDVMHLYQETLLPPKIGEVQLRQTAIGFNYIDVYQRSGIYPLELPTGIGHEAAGVVELLGPGIQDFQIGDRVVYMGVS